MKYTSCFQYLELRYIDQVIILVKNKNVPQYYRSMHVTFMKCYMLPKYQKLNLMECDRLLYGKAGNYFGTPCTQVPGTLVFLNNQFHTSHSKCLSRCILDVKVTQANDHITIIHKQFKQMSCI